MKNTCTIRVWIRTDFFFHQNTCNLHVIELCIKVCVNFYVSICTCDGAILHTFHTCKCCNPFGLYCNFFPQLYGSRKSVFYMHLLRWLMIIFLPGGETFENRQPSIFAIRHHNSNTEIALTQKSCIFMQTKCKKCTIKIWMHPRMQDAELKNSLHLLWILNRFCCLRTCKK